MVISRNPGSLAQSKVLFPRIQAPTILANEPIIARGFQSHGGLGYLNDQDEPVAGVGPRSCIYSIIVGSRVRRRHTTTQVRAMISLVSDG
mmetsp:Transcript_12756/g.28498  ORF Transcript_12756/g.28498 Transcript_12756/m.28498 type:complete len:90 (-) Transcript_12756:629-898(-)